MTKSKAITRDCLYFLLSILLSFFLNRSSQRYAYSSDKILLPKKNKIEKNANLSSDAKYRTASKNKIEIERINIVQNEEKSTIIIESNLPLKYRHDIISKPDRFYIDLLDIDEQNLKIEQPSTPGIIKTIRKGYHKDMLGYYPPYLRLTADLIFKAIRKIKQDDNKLIIEILPTQTFNKAQTTCPDNPNIKDVNHQSTSEDEHITLDFYKADLTEITQFINKITGKDYLIDKKTKNKITILCSQKIPVTETWRIFQTILKIMKYTIISEGRASKIIPLKKTSNSADGSNVFFIRVIPLEFIDAKWLEDILSPLISEKEGLLICPPNHAITISNCGINPNRLGEIIEAIDLDGVKKDDLKVISLKFASALNLTREIMFNLKKKNLEDEQKKKMSDSHSLDKEIFKIVPDVQTNSLIIAAVDKRMKKITNIISHYDKKKPEDLEDMINICQLYNTKAEELAKVLNYFISEHERVFIKTNINKDVTILKDKCNITPDVSTNSLIITASSQDYLILKRLIKKLDISTPQIFLETLIAEVKFGNTNNTIGSKNEWDILDQSPLENKLDQGGKINFISATNERKSGDLAIGISNGNISIGGEIYPNLNSVIQAYKKNKEISILSTPHIMVSNNEEAEIIIGQEIPIHNSLQKPDSATSKFFEYKDIGLTLRISPQIKGDGEIELTLYQETKNFTEKLSSKKQPPTTTKRQVKTTVVVKNGQTIVIGGLIKEDTIKIKDKTPFWGNIPILGIFFQTSKKISQKRNLQIFITPTIIDSPSKLDTLAAGIK
ncbi:MAG: type II secretion system secretin GspD [bacterium]